MILMTEKDWLGESNQLGVDIWNKKYKHGDETFEGWIERVSGGNTEIAKLIKEKKFLFGGRILANRGLHKTGKKITYSNCYVTGVEDNIESIFDCAKKLARTYSYGGGIGVDISKLSPNGARINNAANETSGPISFMDLYSMVTGLIGQGGRRGALMLSMDVKHPDIEEFIDVKNNLEKVTKANISVRISDDFMKAVENNEDWELSFTRQETGETITKTVNAKKLMEKLAKNNWNMAEPGVLFWDRISNWNLLSNTPDFKYAGTNPCAEEPLPEGGSCLLGSINLSEFVTNDKRFDFNEFKDTVNKAVYALNEVLDEGLPLHPLTEQRESVRDWRQIGLGVMGIADMLIKMEITYGSEEALKICDQIGFYMINTAIKASAFIAKEKGAFPKYDGKYVLDTPFFADNTSAYTQELVKEYGLRNSQLLTIAPTGTLSTMLGISGGIEPVFANSYTRRTESLHGEEYIYKVYTPIVSAYMEKNGITEEEDLPAWFITSSEIPSRSRVDMQAVWQKHIDASISSTVNLPNSATPEEVEDIYRYAWESGLKGITVYRAGCAREGILVQGNTETKAEPKVHQLARGDVLMVKDEVIGRKRKLVTGCGSLHCTAFFDPITGDLLETYLSKGSAGGCNNFMIGLSRMISLAARGGCDIYSIIDQLNSCGTCPSYAVRRATKGDTSKGACCPTAVGNALIDMYNEIQEELGLKEDITETDDESVNSGVKCPSCGDELVFEGGCNTCKSCGWSKCD